MTRVHMDRLMHWLAHRWDQLAGVPAIPDSHVSRSFTQIVTRLGMLLIFLWLLMLGSAPVVLLIAVGQIANVTVEWLLVAAGLLGVTALVITSLWLPSSVITARQRMHALPRRTWMRWSVVACISCGFLVWLLFSPVAAPPTLAQSALSLIAGCWFVGVVSRIMIQQMRTLTAHTRRTWWIMLGFTSCFSIWVLLLMINRAFALERVPEWQVWHRIEHLSRLASITFGALLHYQGSLVPAHPTRHTNLIVAIVGAGIVMGIVVLFLNG